MTNELLIIIIAVVLLGLVVFIPRRHRNQEKYDGELKVVGYNEDTGIPDLTLIITQDPIELMKKQTVRLKMIDETK